jgi:hypothetical protein
MRRETFKGAFIFVEGASDAKFYAMFIDTKQCQLIITEGRTVLLDACRVLERALFDGFFGIIDADFDHVDSKIVGVKDVFPTDLHDAECSMLATSAFDKLLQQLAVESKLQSWNKLHCGEIRDHLLRESSKVGYLLWFSNLEKLNLHFSALEVKDYADPSTLNVNLKQLVRHVKNKSSRHDLPDDFLIGGIEKQMSVTQELWQVVRGHDFVDLFGFGLRSAWGNWKSSEVTCERLEIELRLAYSENHFLCTRLFGMIRAWEISHASFHVLRRNEQGLLGLGPV